MPRSQTVAALLLLCASHTGCSEPRPHPALATPPHDRQPIPSHAEVLPTYLFRKDLPNIRFEQVATRNNAIVLVGRQELPDRNHQASEVVVGRLALTSEPNFEWLSILEADGQKVRGASGIAIADTGEVTVFYEDPGDRVGKDGPISSGMTVGLDSKGRRRFTTRLPCPHYDPPYQGKVARCSGHWQPKLAVGKYTFVASTMRVEYAVGTKYDYTDLSALFALDSQGQVAWQQPLRYARSLALAPDGAVWVNDGYVILRFSPEGQLQDTFNLPKDFETRSLVPISSDEVYIGSGTYQTRAVLSARRGHPITVVAEEPYDRKASQAELVPTSDGPPWVFIRGNGFTLRPVNPGGFGAPIHFPPNENPLVITNDGNIFCYSYTSTGTQLGLLAPPSPIAR